MTIQKINEKLATCSAILWTWTTSAQGLHPVKIRVTYDRKNKYFNAQHGGEKIFISESKWKELTVRDEDGKVIGFKNNLRGANKTIVESITASLAEARKAVTLTTANGRQFTFSTFTKKYVNEDISGGFLTSFQSYLDELQKEDRIGSYNAYKNAMSAFKAFRNDKDINPVEITPLLLKDFDKYLRRKKKIKTARGKEVFKQANSTTVAMYMRAIKAVFNYISEDHPELKEVYPFATRQNDRKRYLIPSGSGDHKGEALDIDTIKAFINTTTDPDTPAHEAKLLWLFSFYCQGINMRDVFNLKYENITGNAIRYVREKTKRTSRGIKIIIEVPLSDELRKIINELSTTDKGQDNYVFPVIVPGSDAMRQDKTIKQKIKMINKEIKVLCQANKLQPFTTYAARHSYASLLKADGRPVELIRELLGHGDIRTTENYLKRFDLEKKQEANEGIFKVLKTA